MRRGWSPNIFRAFSTSICARSNIKSSLINGQ
jgi:hypothetical protein